MKKQIKNEKYKMISPFAHPNARDFVIAYSKQDENTYDIYSHYFRGGSSKLATTENKVAELVGIKKGHLALTTSGMAAVINVLEIANLTAGNVVVHGETEYSQIYNYINLDLKERGIIAVEVDFGDVDAIETALTQSASKYGEEAIKVVFFETVGNGPSTPVLEIKKFLDLPILKKVDPLVVIDNTLPTNSIVHLAEIIKESKLKIIGVESATKFYLKNQDLGGLFFTESNELMQMLLTKRKRIGVTPGPSLIDGFVNLLPKINEEFDERNKRIMKNTKFLAETCTKAAGYGRLFTVSYPNLVTHKNYEYAQKLSPDGIAPVFFISTPEVSPYSTEELFYYLDDTGGFRDMIITESFGFERTCVSHGSRYGGYIRIAGGEESEQEIKKLADDLLRSFSGLDNK